MKKLTRLEEYLKRTGHKKPTTRREFIAAGFSGLAGYLAMPSALSILAKSLNAEALECGGGASSSNGILPRLININPAGGMGIQGVVVGLDNDENGQLLPTYSAMSMGKLPPMAQKFGVIWNTGNPFYSAMTNILQKYGVLDNEVRVINIVNQSTPDTADNKIGVQGMAFKAGFNGDKLPFLGQSTRRSGAYLENAVFNDMPFPLNIKSFDTIKNATQIQGGALGSFTAQQTEAVLKAIGKFNARQLAAVSTANGAETLNNLIQCAGIKNLEIIKSTGGGGIDPRTNPTISTIWNDRVVNPNNEYDLTNSPLNSGYLAQAAIIYSSLTSAAGFGSVMLDRSYDYHATALFQSQAADRYVGDMIARTIASAKALNVPCAIVVNSDGSCISGASDQPNSWNTDGFDGSHLLFLFRPGGGINLKSGQIGAWGKDQRVKLVAGLGPGNNEQLTGAITMANILKFAGMTDKIQAVTGLSPNDRNIKVE